MRLELRLELDASERADELLDEARAELRDTAREERNMRPPRTEYAVPCTDSAFAKA